MQKPIYGLSLVLILTSWVTQAADNNILGSTRADPVLARFVQTVVETNPRVQAARAAREASSAFRDAASRPLYNPELSLDVEDGDSDIRSIGISQTLDWGGKRKARTAVAESDRLVVEAEYLLTRWGVIVELLDGLALHQTGVERDALANSRRLLMDEFADLAQRRFDAGDLNQVELDLARLASTDARIQKATAGAALAEARQAVRNLTPRSPPQEWPTLSATMPSIPPNAGDLQLVVQELPEVMAARRQVETADAVVELRRRERRPDPTLSLAGGDEDGETLIGVNVSIPLFIRNRFSHEVTAALAIRSQAQQISNDVMQRAHSRLVSAAERYELSRGGWSDWEKTGQTSLTRQTELLKRLWEAGELSTTDYLVQLRQTLDVQESALDLRQALWRAWFEWLTASGQVDTWLAYGGMQ